MRSTLSAEWFWTRRRRALRRAALLVMVLVCAVVVARWLSTDADITSAIAEAEQLAADAAANGVDIPTSATYVEPRYQLALQMPSDSAGLAAALMLVGLVTASMSVGGEWRTGIVRLTFEPASSRVRPTLARLVVWWSAWTIFGLVALATGVAGLTFVGSHRGLSGGVELGAWVGVILRGGFVVGAGALVGAALATALRSDAAVVALVLGYVLVGEIVLPALLATSGYASPGSLLVDFVVSNDIARPIVMSCGQVPRCEIVYVSSAGSPVVYAVVVMTMLGTSALAAWRSRTSIWR